MPAPTRGGGHALGELDAATRQKVQAGCNFVNAEVSRLRGRLVVIGIACFVGALLLMLVTGMGDPRFPVGVAILVFVYFVNRSRKELASSYKGIVIRRIVSALGRGLSYKPTSSFTKAQFEGLDVFKERAEIFRSEDEVSARKNAVKYSLHEVTAARRDNSDSRLGASGFVQQLIWRAVSSTSSHGERVFFKGLVAKLDFNKNFAGHTVVVPDREGQILGGLLGESRSRRKKDLVMLENPNFERVFSVYSTNDQEARYLITPKLMELVLQAQSLLGGELRLCFTNNSLYVTVPQSADHFEVKLFGGSITPEGALGDLLDVVALAERLVDTLDLETRIWTKV
jgi:hypothetical protein